MTKIKRPFAQVKRIADQLVNRLAPYCERIELAGSLRREKSEVGDIEIVAIPKPKQDMFGHSVGSVLDDYLATLPIEFIRNGDKYKQFQLTTSAGSIYAIDLFLQSPQTWAMNYLIRTGSKDFTQWIFTKRALGGAMLNDCRSMDAQLWQNGKVVPLADEKDVFDFLGIQYVEPQERVKGLWNQL